MSDCRARSPRFHTEFTIRSGQLGRGVLSVLLDLGTGVDVVSGGCTARFAPALRRRTSFSSVRKTDRELAGYGRRHSLINAESEAECAAG
jgi:diaminopimelate decarboxylase